MFIKPATPRLNGKVERSHRIDQEEFYRMLEGVVIDDTSLFNERLKEWEEFYNFNWLHGALGGQTPYERLRPYAPGNVDGSVTVAQRDGPRGRAFLAVEDVGPGMPADERHRVTDRFFRGRTAAKGGTGLGLAIVRELAEKWGGTVVVEAADGGGTGVEVRLKAAT